MSGPQRIQRKRTKGWRMPDAAVYVGRPSRWGNPYEVRPTYDGRWALFNRRTTDGPAVRFGTHAEAVVEAVMRHRVWVRTSGAAPDLSDLAGRDLACWCPLDQPCHADVLLELANGGVS